MGTSSQVNRGAVSCLLLKSLLLAVAASALLPHNDAVAADPWPADGGTQIWSGGEPSGIVWHERLGKLLWVHDNGWVNQMDTDGTLDWSFYVAKDLEGITVADPDTDYVYLGIEQSGAGVYMQAFNISTIELEDSKVWMFADMNGHGNSGLEALTYVPRGEHAFPSIDKGLFYAGLQADGLIYVYNVDLSSEDGDVTYVDYITPQGGPTYDLSGLHYHAETGTLYAVYDGSNLLLELETDGTLIHAYNLPGLHQEGVTLLPSCPSTTTDIFIAQDDSTTIIRYGSYPVDLVDDDCDGLTDAEEAAYGTDPDDEDTDSDGISDYDEVWYDGDGGYSPYDQGQQTGTDTDANDADTDEDAYSDYIEVNCGGDPISPGDGPPAVRINFQPSSCAIPSGYCADDGVSYSPIGYGWL